MSQSVSLGSSANTWRKAASGGYFGGKRSRVIYHWKHQGCHTCLCALMELYGTRGGFSVKWDIKLSCFLGRLCAVAVPYASCVIFQLLPLFVATAVVLLSCYIKFSGVAVGFFSFWIFPPSRCVKGPYGTAIISGPAGNSHPGSTPEQGCTSKKKMKEGGRGEGGRDYFQEQNLTIFRACVVRQATLLHPHEPHYCPPQPAISAWYKMLVWSPSPLFLTKAGRTAACRVLSAMALLREWLWAASSGCNLEGVWHSMV